MFDYIKIRIIALRLNYYYWKFGRLSRYDDDGNLIGSKKVFNLYTKTLKWQSKIKQLKVGRH